MKRFCCVVVMAWVAGWAVGAAHGQEMGLKGIEVRAGYAGLDEGDAGGTYILSGTLDLGKFTPELGLEIGVDYWSKSWDVGQWDWSWSNIGFLGNVRYDFVEDASFRPFIFGGIAFCYQSWDWEIANCQGSVGLCELDDSELEFGVDFGAGADLSSGDGMTPTVRGGYNSNGGADYWFIQGGVKFPF